jgi:hypothetical protein
MADNNSRTQLTIAVIGLFSAVTVALIANYDKIFPRRPAPVVASQPSGSAGTIPSAKEAQPAEQPVVLPQNAPIDGTPDKIAEPGTVATLATAKIAGQWEDESDPFRFAFTQDGAAFAYTASENGAPRGTGKGTIFGRTLVYDFQDGSYAGSCRATLADDGKHISGTCKPNSGDTFDVHLRRRAALIAPNVLFKPHAS